MVALRDEVTRYSADRAEGDPPSAPVVELEIEIEGESLRLFSVAARIENAADITLDGLHIETFLPADARSRQLLGG